MGSSAPVSPIKPSSRLFVELAHGATMFGRPRPYATGSSARNGGVTFKGGETGLDMDEFDPYCRHLLVRESETGRVVGCTCILTDQNADRIGRFYSEGEFDLQAIRAPPGRIWRLAVPVSPPSPARAPRLRYSGPVWPASSICTGTITCSAVPVCRWRNRTYKRQQS